MSHSEAEGLQDRKRRATANRIATTAARLAAERGLTGATVDLIAADAEVARATFFRYYQSKEHAVAEGITAPWLTKISEALARQPADLEALEAVTAAFAELGADPSVPYDQIRDFATLTRTSTTLDAWTLRAYRRFEDALAELLAPRFAGLSPDDQGPRMAAAIVMAAVRVSLDDWVRDGGSLSERIGRALRSVRATTLLG